MIEEIKIVFWSFFSLQKNDEICHSDTVLIMSGM